MTVCCWLLAAVAYIGFILGMARFLSRKWHPQVGEIEARHNDGS